MFLKGFAAAAGPLDGWLAAGRWPLAAGCWLAGWLADLLMFYPKDNVAAGCNTSWS